MKHKIAVFPFAVLLALALLVSCSAPAQPLSQSAAAPVASSASVAPAPEEAAPEESGYTIERRTRDAETPMGEPGTWSIFIYMCGTDLETDASMASLNLWEIMQEPPADNVNIIVQTGGTEAWGKPMDAEVSADNDKRLTVAWSFENIESREGQNIPRVRVRATVLKAKLEAHVTVSFGNGDSESGVGACTVE